MKRHSGYIFLIMVHLILASYASEQNQYTYPLTFDHADDLKKISEHKEFETDYNKLQLAKFYMLNGSLEPAEKVLVDLENEKSPIFEIRMRYLATIYFIKGNFTKVLDTLKRPEMQLFFTQAKTCILKMISHIYLKQKEELIKTWQKCEPATEARSDNELTWIKTIVSLYLNEDPSQKQKLLENIDIENIGPTELAMYLKLGIYLDQQDKFIPRFKFFTQEVLEDEKLRELIGLNYYRSGKLNMAYDVLKDVSTSNAEVFKGNIFLAKNELEQAYAQFKLALLKKSHSQNALERLIPLAWKLGQFTDGTRYIEKLKDFSKNDDLTYYTLISTFLTMQEKNDTVTQFLKIARRMKNLVEPLEITQLSIINQHRKKQLDKIQTRYDHSCVLGDAIGCWFLLADGSWESFHEFTKMNTDKKVKNKELAILEMYTTNKIETFKDKELINQKRIEDLDNQLIELLKTR